MIPTMRGKIFFQVLTRGLMLGLTLGITLGIMLGLMVGMASRPYSTFPLFTRVSEDLW